MNRLVGFVVVVLALAATTVQAFIPASFDARSQWPSCIPAIMNQGSCGSCYAFSGVQVLSSHMCIATNGNTNVQLSPQHIVSCGSGSAWTGSNGCDGGWPVAVYNFVKNSGCTSCTSRCTSGCNKYVSGDGRTIPSCRTSGTCPSSSSSLYLYKWGFDQGGYFDPSTPISTIQQYILNYGPISAAFMVTQQFYDFFSSNPSGVFKSSCPSSWNDPRSLGGHAVVIIGWGTASDGTPYWLLANSWSTSWGDHGVFRMKRGVNLCFIENYLSTVVGSKSLNRNLEPEFMQYISPEMKMPPPYAFGSPVPIDSSVDAIKDIVDWVLSQLHLADNEVINQIIPKSATVQVVNGINFNIKFDTVASSNMFQIDALINRSPDGSLTLLNSKVDLMPITIGFFGMLSVGTVLVVIAAPVIVIGIAATVVIIKKRKQIKKLATADAAPKEDELGLREEFLAEQTQQDE